MVANWYEDNCPTGMCCLTSGETEDTCGCLDGDKCQELCMDEGNGRNCDCYSVTGDGDGDGDTGDTGARRLSDLAADLDDNSTTTTTGNGNGNAGATVARRLNDLSGKKCTAKAKQGRSRCTACGNGKYSPTEPDIRGYFVWDVVEARDRVAQGKDHENGAWVD